MGIRGGKEYPQSSAVVLPRSPQPHTMGGAASMPQQLAELDTHPVDVRHDKSTDCSIAVKLILPRDGPTFSRYELQMQRADTRDGEWRTVGAFFKGGTGTAGAL